MVPRTIHYGLVYNLGDWSYDKHWYFDFDPHACPPWDLSVEKYKHGIFPPPPSPDELDSKVRGSKPAGEGGMHGVWPGRRLMGWRRRACLLRMAGTT